jgi:serine/threonine protein kinase
MQNSSAQASPSQFSQYGYEIEKELGHNLAGGRITYLAREIATGNRVVIKQFQFARVGSTWSAYDAYDREIQVLKGLNHPGIPRYLSSVQMEDGFCMIQEYKQAEPLSNLRSFHLDDIQRIAVSVLEILVYLQNRVPPLIHRDIKPENILVDEDINVYLVDFGFARIGEGEVGISSVVKGTLGFMPPEQLFNRKLTEASDLYGLGVTLICLLTRTASTDVGSLIDITYRVNFKHLAPKLSVAWINWLEKMAEPRSVDRFPNAAAALAAMPSHPMRLPEVRFSQAKLELVANRRNELLSQTLTIDNVTPETILEGCWEVAAHPSDPPHQPHQHRWIAVRPAQFSGNRTDCQIIVDTSHLISGKTYTRQLLLHSNALPQTQSVTLQVRTAAMPALTARLPYRTMALLFACLLITAWILTQVAVGFDQVLQTLIVGNFGLWAGAAVGFNLSAWALSTAGVTAGSRTSVIAGLFSILLATLVGWGGGTASSSLQLFLIAGLGCLTGIVMGTASGIAAGHLVSQGMNQPMAVLLVLLVTAAAGCTGLVSVLGWTSPLVIASLAGSYVALAVVWGHSRLTRMKLVQSYRYLERNLIKP